MRIARGISIANTSKPISTAAAFDADAVAFFTAANITDTTQKSAVNQLVLDLKSASIWTKMKALYPIVGGVASAHAVNLKTPGTYNLSFATGWTHSSTGMTPNGATYADTYLNPNSILTSNSVHLSYYSRTQLTSTNSHDMGCETASSTNNLDLFHYFNGVSNKGVIDGTYPTNAAQNNTGNTLGLAIGSRTSSTSLKLFFNNSLLNTNTNTKILGYPSFNIYLGATDQGGVANSFTTKQCAFASIGDGLTDAEASAYYTAVQTYQTTLGRQV